MCTLWGGCPTCTDPAFGISPRSRLSSGKLQDLGVVEGSKLTLVPTVEAGLMVSGLFLLLPPSLPLSPCLLLKPRARMRMRM